MQCITPITDRNRSIECLPQRKSSSMVLDEAQLDETIKSFDVFPKMEEEHIVKTEMGGLCMYLLSCLFPPFFRPRLGSEDP